MPYPGIIMEMIESRCKIGSKSKPHSGSLDKTQFLMAFARLCSHLLNIDRIPVILPALFTSSLSHTQFKDPEI